MNTAGRYSKMTFYFILKQTGRNQTQIPSRDDAVCVGVLVCIPSNGVEGLRANPAQHSADVISAPDG